MFLEPCHRQSGNPANFAALFAEFVGAQAPYPNN
jgi:hypothetical protein